MEKNELIRKALRFPIDSVIKRYMKHYGVTEDEAHEHELELKRYLALSALNRGKRYCLRSPLANLLQMFIVFTVLYAEFCTSVAGAYIHYTPMEDRSNVEAVEGYSQLLADYEAVFQVQPPEHIWPRDAQDVDAIPSQDRDSADAFPAY